MAPFLTFDPDPYIVVGDDGRLSWMVDGYTTSASFPYARHYVLGRDQKKARLSAVCDALWQSKRYRNVLERCVLAPIRTRVDAERNRQRAQTAATRVDFFTLVRGED